MQLTSGILEELGAKLSVVEAAATFIHERYPLQVDVLEEAVR